MNYRLYQILKAAFLHADASVGNTLRDARYGKLPIQENKVFFSTHQATFACNPKYITEHLLRTHPELDLVWVAKKEIASNPASHGFPRGVRVVAKDSADHFREQMTAKVWVDNALTCLWRNVPKRDEQLYLDTWHGSLGIKRLDTQDNRYWISVAKKSNRCIDAMLTNSAFEDEVMHTAYWPDVRCIQTGHARNDLFFDGAAMEDLSRKVRHYYALGQDVKIALYAPTFREDRAAVSLNIAVEKINEALTQRFGGNWAIFVRLHHRDQGAGAQHTDGYINATAYPDIQELMAAADVGITDYSSWIYDFALTGRPGFIYAYDLNDFEAQRGFYYPLQSTPFPLAQTEEELVEAIKSFDSGEYASNLSSFLNEKGCMENGHACERIESLILNHLREQYPQNN